PAGELRGLLGLTTVNYIEHQSHLAVIDSALGERASGEGGKQVSIDNFTFAPAAIMVKAGDRVVWTNHDDIPHTVVENNKSFKSNVLDTNDKYEHQFDKPGTYDYFCSLHPHMTGKVVVS